MPTRLTRNRTSESGRVPADCARPGPARDQLGRADVLCGSVAALTAMGVAPYMDPLRERVWPAVLWLACGAAAVDARSARC